MKFDNIMIVTDLDGTFYNEEHDFHPKSMKAVEYFTKNGGLFTIATGRVPVSLEGRLETFANITNAPAILCNGALFYDFKEKRALKKIELDREKATDIVKLVSDNFSVFRIRCSANGAEVPIKSAADTATLTDWLRVSFDDKSTENLTRIREAIEARYRDDFSYMFAGSEIFEFQNKSATKGQALNRLREMLVSEGKADASLKIYAAGDYENDLDMVINADVGCCPDDACDLIKSVADMRLCPCKDGAIADLIEKIEKSL